MKLGIALLVSLFSVNTLKDTSKIDIFKLAKIKALTTGMLLSILVGCASSDSSKASESKNVAPKIGKTNINYNVVEGNSRKVSFSTIIIDAGIVDEESDSIFLKINGEYDFLEIKNDSIAFTSPNINKDTKFTVTFTVKDAKGNISPNKITVNFIVSNGIDDNPIEFNESDLIITNNQIIEGEPLKIKTTANDTDGIDNISYAIKDSNGNEISDLNGTLHNNTEESISLDGLPVGEYSIEVKAIGHVKGTQNPNSEKTLTKSFEIVNDLKVEISNIDINSTFTEGSNLEGSFTINSANTDGITEVSYKIVSEDGKATYYSKKLDITNNGKYNISYDMSGLELGNYKVEITAKDNGNTDNSVDTKSSVFEIVSLNTSPAIDISNMTINGEHKNDEGRFPTLSTGNTFMVRGMVLIGTSYKLTSKLYGSLIENVDENGVKLGTFKYSTEKVDGEGYVIYGLDTITIEVTDEESNVTSITVEVKVS